MNREIKNIILNCSKEEFRNEYFRKVMLSKVFKKAARIGLEKLNGDEKQVLVKKFNNLENFEIEDDDDLSTAVAACELRAFNLTE